MNYPAYRALGLPIGDGAVESGNKLVVEARLKGSGMHWARPHVDAMLALRNVVCSDRWEEAWPQISQQLRQAVRQRRLAQRRERIQSAVGRDAGPPAPPTERPPVARQAQPAPAALPATTAITGPRRPAPNHPWRRMPIGRARFKAPCTKGAAKT